MEIEEIILITYIISLTILCFFSFHGFTMIYFYFKTYKKRTDDLTHDDLILKEYPFVTIQIPLFNERYVILRLINACIRMDYPKERIEFQILDDSTDDSTEIISKHIEPLKKQGYIINHIHRTDRTGYKAGALKEGLKTALGEYVAIFDADFIPRKKFLLRTLPYFKKIPKLGLVQTRWEHLNRDYSVLTKTQAVALDGHFVIEQAVRNRADFFINFNGTAGIWKKECILDAGNWEADTLTEDLDLSYRAQMKGWKFKYLVNFTSPAELPAEINSLRSQQFRWTKGAIETAKKIFPKVLKSKMPIKLKFEAFIHLCSNLAYPFILLCAILNLPVMLIKLTGNFDDVFKFMSIFIFAFISSFIFYLYSQKDIYTDWQKRIIYFPVFMAGAMGLSVNNTKAVFEGLINKKSEFVRTPKFKITNENDSWKGKKYVPKKLNFIVYIEALLAVYCFAGLTIAIVNAQIAAIPFNLMFCLGFGLISFLSIKQVITSNKLMKLSEQS
ncbi:MAG TPA: glycosyltransferase family 2 protein [Ignavibacteria bacterium]|nr:glycosyltransferase family 2 protein [Ignavibacteria bacterium]